MPIILNPALLDTIAGETLPDGIYPWEDPPFTYAFNVDPGNLLQAVVGFIGIGGHFEPNRSLMNAADMNAMVQIIGLWDDLIAPGFVFSPGDEDADITVNQVSNMPAGQGGFAYNTLMFPVLPNDADVFLRAEWPIMAGQRGWATAVHEFGHAIGLQHPGSYNASDGALSYANDREHDEDTARYTVMSYFDPGDDGTPAGWTRGEVQTPMVYDVLVAQRIYGADLGTRVGDTVYGFNATADRAVFRLDVDAANPGRALTTPVFTIWDAGGDHDAIDASGYVNAQRIDLAPGSYSDIGMHAVSGVNLSGNIAIAFDTWIEDAVGGSGDDTLLGNARDNRLDGGGGNDVLDGGEGNDTLLGGAGADRLVGGWGNDRLEGGEGDDVLDGGSSDDVLLGGAGADRLDGGQGWDRLEGGTGADTLDGGNDADTLLGEDGADFLVGGGGDDLLDGGSGEDALFGGPGHDRLLGGTGLDVLNGGPGNDTLSGGVGRDTFSFAAGDGADTITDFQPDPDGVTSMDLLDLGAAQGIHSFDDILARSSDLAGGAGVFIDFGLGDSITLLGVGKDALHPGFFAFGEAPPEGGEFTAAPPAISFEQDVAALADGRFVLVWKQHAFDPGGWGVWARIFEADGSGGEPFRVNSTDAWDYRMPKVVAQANGNFAVAWAVDEYADGAATWLRARVFAPDGRALGDDFRLNTTPEANEPGTTRSYRMVVTDLAPWGEDGFVAVWTSFLTSRYMEIVRSRVVEDDGALPRGEATTAQPHPLDYFGTPYQGYDYRDARVVQQDDGEVIVSFLADGMDPAASSHSSVAAIRFVPEQSPSAVTVLMPSQWGPGVAVTRLMQRHELVRFDDGPGGLEDAYLMIGLAGEVGSVWGPADLFNLGRTTVDALVVERGIGTPFRLDAAPWGATGSIQSASWVGEIAAAARSGGGALVAWDYLRRDGDAIDAMLVTGNGEAQPVRRLNGWPSESRLEHQRGFVVQDAAGLSDGRVVVTWSDVTVLGAYGTARAIILNQDLLGVTLGGTVGDDRLVGSGWDDRITGGAGDDVLIGRAGADRLDGGAGSDTADYGMSLWGVQVDLARVGEQSRAIVLSHSAGDLLLNIENLRGSAYDDRLAGDASANRLDGQWGADTLYGGDGEDVLTGGPGADHLIGGPGRDIASYAGAGVGVSVDLGFPGPQPSVGEAAGDVLEEIEDLVGSVHDDVLVGDAGPNRLFGGGGADRLSGGGGDDTIDGGHGVDTVRFAGPLADYLFAYDIATDRLTVSDTVAGRDGIDTVTAVEWLAFADGRHWAAEIVEALDYDTITGTAGDDSLVGGALHEWLDGLAGDDTLEGGAGDDTLDGGAGHDRLIGGAGDDVLDGGPGHDSMFGGPGHDLYVVDAPGDLVEEDGTSAGGYDAVRSSVNFSLPPHVESLVLAGAARHGAGNSLDNQLAGNELDNGLSGLAGDDVLIGNEGNDTLAGGAGADFMIGGPGNDRYIVDNVDDWALEHSDAPAEIDTVVASVNFALPPNVEQLVLTGAARHGRGNGRGNHLAGNELDNGLSGLAGNDTLWGGAGNDTLAGGEGDDSMVGGPGNDRYLVDSAGDVVVETSGLPDEIDHVVASVSCALPARVEQLSLVGAATAGFGNALPNHITGNERHNTLFGGAGHDTLHGGAGDDTLEGGSGNDRMVGGAGSDHYVVDALGDVVVETGASVDEIDTVSSSLNHVLGENVERLVLTGAARHGAGNILANVIAGNALDNGLSGLAGDDTLVGGAGQDTLAGGDGDDVLEGGAGNDRLNGGAGADAFRFVTVADGLDTVVDFARGVDRIEVVAANFGLVAGATANLFVGAAPNSGAAAFVYTSANGLLAFDADGQGPGAAVALAILQSRPAHLLPADIVLGP
jgi:Ca2+-binding RTX toxin-like protein